MGQEASGETRAEPCAPTVEKGRQHPTATSQGAHRPAELAMGGWEGL